MISDSKAVAKLKWQISLGMFKHGPEFFNSKEYKELSSMLESQRKTEVNQPSV